MEGESRPELAEELDDARRAFEGERLAMALCRARILDAVFSKVVPPTKVGRYRLIRAIGSGGSGDVFEAHDPTLDRRVALKLLRRSADDDERDGAQRMLTEARAMARISHPAIVPVFEVGEADGLPYVAMELVEGSDVRIWAQQASPHWRELVELFIGLADGLQAVHSASLLHHDVKPANILVEPGGRARLGDFGIAGHLADRGDWVRAGTPQYLAPEVARNESVDERSDLHGLGVTLFELLYGSPPGAEGSSTRASWIRGTPPGWLRRELERACAEDRAQRHASVEAFALALRKGLARRRRWQFAAVATLLTGAGVALWSRPGADHPDPRGCQERADRVASIWNPDRRQGIEASFLASGRPFAPTTFASVETALTTWLERWSEHHADACATGTESPSGERACLEDQLSAFEATLDLFEAADPLVVERALATVSALPQSERCRSQPISSSRRAAASARTERGSRAALMRAELYIRAGRLDEAAALIESAPEPTREDLRASTQLMLGRIELQRGHPETALEHLEASVAAALRADASLEAARAWTELVTVTGFHLGQLERAEQFADMARAVLDRTPDPRTEAALDNALGQVRDEQWRFDEALELHREALELWKTVPDLSPIDLGGAHTRVGVSLWRLDRSDEALAAHREAQRLWSSAVGEWHPLVASSLSNQGITLCSAGECEEGAKHMERAIEIWTATNDEGDVNLAAALSNLGDSYRRIDRLEEAADAHERALVEWKRATGARHPHVAIALRNSGVVATQLGDHSRALNLYAEALDIQRAVLGDGAAQTLRTRFRAAESRLATGAIPDAVAELEQILPAVESLSLEPTGAAEVRLALAHALWARNDGTDRARAKSLVDAATQTYGRAEQPLPGEYAAWVGALEHPPP